MKKKLNCLSFCLRFYKITANGKGLWQVGHLKLNCPNVCRYKLLILNYLPMFKMFPSAETKVQKNSQSWDLFRPPHLPQTHVIGSVFSFAYLLFKKFNIYFLISCLCSSVALSFHLFGLSGCGPKSLFGRWPIAFQKDGWWPTGGMRSAQIDQT